MKISAINIKVGDKLPPFYYGVSHHLWFEDSYVFYLIPLNYVVRWWLRLSDIWNRFRIKEGYYDRKVYRIVKHYAALAREEGYNLGVNYFLSKMRGNH